jgi:hypothetical protein
MKTTKSITTLILLFIVTLTVTSCVMPFAQATPTSTPLPTSTATMEPTSTATLKPTSTITLTPTIWHLPTNTIDTTATQQYNEMLDFVTGLKEDGYLPSINGVYHPLPDYSNQWAQLNWYQWDDTGWRVKDFAMRVHMAWSSDTETPNPSGCGIVFRIQNTDEHYVVFLLSLGYVEYGITTDAFRRQPLAYWGASQNAGEADFAMTSIGGKTDVFVNGKHIKTFTGYEGKWEEGGLGYTTLSGTNAGYGTQCDITDGDLWLVKN